MRKSMGEMKEKRSVEHSLQREAEQYFHQMDQERDALITAWQYLEETIENALTIQDYSQLCDLIFYLEQGEGYLIYQYIGESHRILRILSIIELERSYHRPVFAWDCITKQQLMEKYLQTVFAIRRLLFQRSEESAAEGICYLQQNPVSVFAVFIILQQELFQVKKALCEQIQMVFNPIWTQEEQQYFTCFFSQIMES